MRFPGSVYHRRPLLLPLRLEPLEARVTPGFLAPQAYDAGPYPSSVAVEDFNGDGSLDLAVTNAPSAGTVSILLGNGDGTFQVPRSFPVGNHPLSVAVGHFRDAGPVDLVVTNNIGGTVSVLLGNGDGTFQPAHNYPLPLEPLSVAVGDFDGDGWPDLVVANAASNDVSILLNDGTGTTRPNGAPSLGVTTARLRSGSPKAHGFVDLADLLAKNRDEGLGGAITVANRLEPVPSEVGQTIAAWSAAQPVTARRGIRLGSAPELWRTHGRAMFFAAYNDGNLWLEPADWDSAFMLDVVALPRQAGALSRSVAPS